MQHIKYTYGQIYKGCLLLAFIFAFTTGKADDTQTLISLSAQTMGSTIGDAAPSIAYNPTKNEYLVVYTDFDGACPTNQELRGQVINAITGEKSGNVLNLTTSEQPCSTHSIADPKVVYNELEDEFLILFKSSTALGAKIKYLSLDANNLLVSSSIMIDEDEIADPFKNCELELDENSNIYAIAYHTENALSESFLTLKFVNGSTKSILAYSVQLDKSNFVAENKGVFGSKLLYNNENILVAFEIRFTAGSEIHGAFINSLTGAIVGDIFQISPSGTASTNYMNPALAFNENSGEILAV
ncbi:MAG: hypothetical protein KAQ62_25605, partial [Cyclobacteriaceae bacterium]|nr:hypothetical protein [Cyclobacteriaceae bacterium]